MMARLFRCLVCWVVCLAAGLALSAHAQALPPVQLEAFKADAASEGVPAPLRIVQGLDASASVAQVAQLPDTRFEAFSPKVNYTFTYEQPIWLHLRVASAAASDGQWQLEFPAILIDRYEVFQKDAAGQWRMSTAGDAVPHRDWALPSMRPRFPLLLPQAGLHDVYIRIAFRLPANLQPVILSREQGVERDSQLMLWSGAIAGLLLAIALTCLHMSHAFRDPVYFWYACYLLASMVTVLTYTGVAHRVLWPGSSHFSEQAISFFVVSVLTCNVLFCRAMFGGLQGRWYHRLTAVLVAVCVLYAALRLLLEDYSRIIPFYNTVVAACFLFIIYSAANALRKGFVFGGYWLLIYTPYLLLCGLAIFKSTGALTLAWLPASTPLAALVLEAVAMLIFINIYSRTKHSQAVREQAASEHDALTGFLNAEHFHRFASKAWARAGQLGNHATLVYVRVEPKDASAQSMLEQEAMMLRSVRMVRTAMREFDVVGRLGRNLLAICVVDRPSNEALAARLSRLVALGLMHDEPMHGVQFTIAAAEHARFFDDYPRVEPALLQLLAVPADAKRKPIRYFNPGQPLGETPSAGAPLGRT